MGRRRVGSGEGSPGTVALTLGTSGSIFHTSGPRNWITNGPGSWAGSFTWPPTAPVGAPGDAPGPGRPPHPSCGPVPALGNAEPAPSRLRNVQTRAPAPSPCQVAGW
ncbi:unconventional myosin-XVI-like [Vulpes lagopus]|uniref:unconventional myosin-XVI-like n=1 Tax=Vulpes lagopus TaxID=494514 RepID=UPI001BC98588|nr:unconventional myosin-XVI-like [Vulpes lagopus]